MFVIILCLRRCGVQVTSQRCLSKPCLYRGRKRDDESVSIHSRHPRIAPHTLVFSPSQTSFFTLRTSSLSFRPLPYPLTTQHESSDFYSHVKMFQDVRHLLLSFFLVGSSCLHISPPSLDSRFPHVLLSSVTVTPSPLAVTPPCYPPITSRNNTMHPPPSISQPGTVTPSPLPVTLYLVSSQHQSH